MALAEYTSVEFLQMHTSMQKKEAAKRLAMSEVGVATKRMKEAGLDTAAYKMAVKCAKKDAQEFRAFINAFTTMVQELRVPGAQQLSLLQFDDPTRVKGDSDYHDEGWLAASLGKDRTASIYDATSGAGVHWNLGYDDYLKSISTQRARENAKLIKGGIKEKVDVVAESAEPDAAPADLVPQEVSPTAEDGTGEPAVPKVRGKRRAKDAQPEEAASEVPPAPPAEDVAARPGDTPTSLELMRKRREEKLAAKNRIQAAKAG